MQIFKKRKEEDFIGLVLNGFSLEELKAAGYDYDIKDIEKKYQHAKDFIKDTKNLKEFLKKCEK